MVAAALLALWFDVRFPALAPASLTRRVGVACAAFVLLWATPVFGGSAVAVYTTVFGILLPAFFAAFLAGIWLLRALRDVSYGV